MKVGNWCRLLYGLPEYFALWELCLFLGSCIWDFTYWSGEFYFHIWWFSLVLKTSVLKKWECYCTNLGSFTSVKVWSAKGSCRDKSRTVGCCISSGWDILLFFLVYFCTALSSRNCFCILFIFYIYFFRVGWWVGFVLFWISSFLA